MRFSLGFCLLAREVLLLASIVVVVAAIGIGVALYTHKVRARAVKSSAATS